MVNNARSLERRPRRRNFLEPRVSGPYVMTYVGLVFFRVSEAAAKPSVSLITVRRTGKQQTSVFEDVRPPNEQPRLGPVTVSEGRI